MARAARCVTSDYRRTASVTSLLSQLEWPHLSTRRRNSRLIDSFLQGRRYFSDTNWAGSPLFPSNLVIRSVEVHTYAYSH